MDVVYPHSVLPREEYANSTFYLSLLLISDTTRYAFMGTFIVLCSCSVIGNLAVIYSMAKRKNRFIQKTLIISLAMSDLLSTIFISLNNLETFSHPLINWTLGPFLCSFVPFCQFWGMTTSSFLLVLIASDRYRNVVHALGKRWNPSKLTCIASTIILWLCTALLSIPMYTFYTHEPIIIVYYKPVIGFYNESAFTCITFKKDELKDYFLWMMNIIFLPLLLIFLWLYYKIAKLIWKHRKPFFKKISTSQNINNAESTTPNNTAPVQNVLHKGKDVRMERKIRTFKIIITLMFVFLICRLPPYIFGIIKLVNVYDDEYIWIWNYTFIALGLLNCILNCLLYTFLSHTLIFWNRLKKGVSHFIREIFCFCCDSSEFDEFEKGNPFSVEEFQKSTKRDSRVKVGKDDAVGGPNENK